MSDNHEIIDITILDKHFQLKCAPEQLVGLQRAARYLDKLLQDIAKEKMSQQAEKIILTAALNLTHDLLCQRVRLNKYIDSVNQHLDGLQSKIDFALTYQEELEV
jgi:cell division protein ZapA